MNKEPKVYKCECCDYNTIKNANLVRHIESKHKNEGNIVPEVAVLSHDLQAELASLKSENLTLKAKYDAVYIENITLKAKLEVYESMRQPAIIPRRSITPTKVIPENKITQVIPETTEPNVFRKKKSGENTLDYLNKFYVPTTYPIMYSEVCKELYKIKPLLSLDNVNSQYAKILKPIIYNKKLIFHSGIEEHHHKLYYVNEEHKWVEDLNYLNDLIIEVEENKYCNIYDLIYEKFEQLLENFPKNQHDEWMVYFDTYKKHDPKQIIINLLDVMKLPDDECEQ